MVLGSFALGDEKGGFGRFRSDGSCCAQRCRGGGGANSGELSEGVRGAFGRLTLLDTAPSQELLDCTHSKARNFKKQRE